MNNELKFDKNSKMIIIPDGVVNIEPYTFENFDKLEEIILPNSILSIDIYAFSNCKSLKKINLPFNLCEIGMCAFEGCDSLEEITIPNSLHYIPIGLFSNCSNLKKVNIHDNIEYIDSIAFYNCKKLENFQIPKEVKSIGAKAFMGCELIKQINIPKNCNTIEYSAFGLMSSLEQITVSTGNENYLSSKNNTVLLSKDGVLLQYAIASDNEKITIDYYKDIFNDIETKSLIYCIADYAFAGAENLKEIHINSELSSIGSRTFYQCENLKDLEIIHTMYGDSFLLHIPLFDEFDERAEIPFKNIVIGDGIKVLCSNLSELFKNAESIKLPDTLEQISQNVFSQSPNLKSIAIPSNIHEISQNTFHPETNIIFDKFGTVKAKDFDMLIAKTDEEHFINDERDNIKIYSFKDGNYYIKIDDFDIVKINRKEIFNCTNSTYLINNPDHFIVYLFNLLYINKEKNDMLINIFSNPKLKEIFKKYKEDPNYINEINNKKMTNVISEIVNVEDVSSELLFNPIIIENYCRVYNIIQIIKNYSDAMNRFFKFNTGFNAHIEIDDLIDYCDLLEEYNRYDRFLYNTIFFENIPYGKQKLLLKYYNRNIKHLLVKSEALDDTYDTNLNDLLNLCDALGVFSPNEELSQRMTTFIIEKMMDENSEIQIVGNKIHSMFDILTPRDEIDYEFIEFFIDNYKELIKLEKSQNGIITRIYSNFREISMTSTSHRGSQRHLKVTIQKCLDFFLARRFEGVNKNNKPLATLLQNFYSESYTLKIAEKIIDESKKAPRNIFSKISYKDNNPIYSYDSNEDLKEKNENDFSFEWLPKQDYDNLILGKYCNCCAHILGVGAGIARASMILDNCQNLVIRNEEGNIIAKMTIYVNRRKGYAVFNTAEINFKYKDSDSLNKIYKAFIRGTKAFMKEYNKNNSIPINMISIGEYRNDMKQNLGNVETKVFDTPNYSTYGYVVDGKKFGTYDGDSKKKQLLVLKR